MLRKEMPEPAHRQAHRHTAVVRATHWLAALCFLALLVSGLEIVLSHPRFYWGEAGNVTTPALFSLPVPASRATVPTGYGFVLPDQNGWSRSLHFEAAWAVVFTGLFYVAAGLYTRHFRNNLLPAGAGAYNLAQRLTYLFVIFVAFPLAIWTGLAMSPAVASVLPQAVSAWGGQESARTIHFFLTLFLVAFLAIHLIMITRAGFGPLVRAMITGRTQNKERS